jgi:hypothetical protein
MTASVEDDRPSIAELQRATKPRLKPRLEWTLGDAMVALELQPMLLEIAAAALALRDAHSALDAIERDMMYVGPVSFDQLVGGRSTHDAKVKINECGDVLLAALARVRP